MENLREVALSGIRSLLLELHHLVGDLPEEQNPQTLPASTEDLISYADRLAGDDAFWERVPARIARSPGEIEAFRRNIPKIARQYGRHNLTPAEQRQILAKYAAGESREDLRAKLRRFLKQCHAARPNH